MLTISLQCVVGHEIVGTAVKVGSKADHGIKLAITSLPHPVLSHIILTRTLGSATVWALAPNLRHV